MSVTTTSTSAIYNNTNHRHGTGGLFTATGGGGYHYDSSTAAQHQHYNELGSTMSSPLVSSTVPTTTTTMHSAGGGRRISQTTMSQPITLPVGAYETGQSRKVSSVVLHEEVSGKIPEPHTKYVEVPQYEEVIRHVAVKEVREIEKIVPRVIEEWVERIVEVPHVEEVVKHVEVPHIQEVVKHVPKVEIRDRMTEVIKHVPKVELRRVEKVVEIPGDIIEVPQPFVVEETVPVPKYHDTEQMLIVAQTIKPVIIEGGKDILVDVKEYEPEVIPVDIHVAKYVDQTLVVMGSKETVHKVVKVPAAQYNSMLRFLNSHLSDQDLQALPYLQDPSGQVKCLSEETQWCAPPEGIKIYGYKRGTIYGEGVPVDSEYHVTKENVVHRQRELDRQFQETLEQFEKEKHLRLDHIEEFNNQSKSHCAKVIASSALDSRIASSSAVVV